MGFWEEEHKKKNIIIGDDGLDIFEEAIEQFYEMTEEHLKRKPTIDEMLLTIMMALNNGGSHYFDDLNDKEVTDIKITTKKVKTLSKVEPGAIFELPLKEVGKLSYALIISGEGKNQYDDILIQYYDLFVDERIEKNELKQLMKKENELFVANTGLTGFLNGSWKVITKINQDFIKEEDLQNLKFVEYRDGNYYVSKGKEGHNAPVMDLEVADPKTAKMIFNPIGMLGEYTIISILSLYFKGMSMEDIIKYEI
ncbi:Imm26 family immunity protein [Bacillus sp. UNC125MFCrub1.1]|uniref:Imm26 family immunity protein n=1 Tax=Bacillus sp. UNC125MFCrub1.1 TaxID=1380371 RepID=UPI000556186F|nr:Imm26 family immunity protein [Bacillus sp. UNC125MFCrub1.1]